MKHRDSRFRATRKSILIFASIFATAMWSGFTTAQANQTAETAGETQINAKATVARFAGVNRYATAAEVSEKTFSPGVNTVFIANGNFFADGLSGGPAAAHLQSPLITIPGTTVPTVVKKELKRLTPKNIIILGGTSVVSSKVETLLNTYTTGTVKRISGSNRYATSANITKLWNNPVDTVYVASGTRFPDALSGGAAAAAANVPLLLTNPAVLPQETTTTLRTLTPANVVIVGGTAAVSDAVRNSINTVLPDANITRVGGQNRYETSAKLIETREPSTVVEPVMLASGVMFPDALAAVPAAVAAGAVFTITQPTCLPRQIAEAVNSEEVTHFALVGGPNVLADSVVTIICGPKVGVDTGTGVQTGQNELKPGNESIAAVEKEVHQRIQKIRADHQLPAYKTSTCLTKYAQSHSRWVAKNQNMAPPYSQEANAAGRPKPHEVCQEFFVETHMVYASDCPNVAERMVKVMMEEPAIRDMILDKRVGKDGAVWTGVGVARDINGKWYVTTMPSRKV